MTLIHMILAFLEEHWLDFLLTVLALTVLVILWKKGNKRTVIRIIKALVAKAEQQYGSKTGVVKLEAVWSELYTHIPWIIRILFTKKELAGYIEDAVKWLAKLLTGNPDINLLSYAQERLLGEDK